MSIFSERLKNLRKAHKVTQKMLSQSLGLAESTVSMYELGEREPNFETLELLADFFNVDIDYLLGSSDKTTNLNIYGNHQKNLDYFIDKPDLLALYKDIHESQNLQLLFDTAKDLTPRDLEMVLMIIKGIRKERGID